GRAAALDAPRRRRHAIDRRAHAHPFFQERAELSLGAEVDHVRNLAGQLIAKHSQLHPVVADGIVPADVAVTQYLPRRLDRASKGVADAADGERIEEVRRVEVRDQDAVDLVAELAGLGGIAYFDQVADAARGKSQFDRLVEGVPRAEAPAEGVRQHFEAL